MGAGRRIRQYGPESLEEKATIQERVSNLRFSVFDKKEVCMRKIVTLLTQFSCFFFSPSCFRFIAVGEVLRIPDMLRHPFGDRLGVGILRLDFCQALADGGGRDFLGHTA